MELNMKIYFACSITGGRQNEAVYAAIVRAMQVAGFDVPTAELASPEVVALEEVVDPVEVYTRDVAWIEASRALVAEISTPSHGVGYEIGYALNRGLPVLCLYREGEKISKMISGNEAEGLEVSAYRNSAEAVQAVQKFLSRL
jgi:nucleoside 2-deoxyribosyltransferase